MNTNSRTILRRAEEGRFGATQIGREEREEVLDVLESRVLFRYESEKSKSRKLETALGEFFGCKHVLAVTNGTAALKASLVGIGIKPGDEVLVSPYTFIATINSIVSVGAVPVFVDIREDLTLDLADAGRKCTQATKAMVSVHIQGDATKVDAEARFCSSRGLFHLEDCAQAFGAKFHGRPVGSFGNVGCFSLQSNKLITSGEGGFLITNEIGVFSRARNFHDQGAVREGNGFGDWDDPHSIFGDNLKISEIQSALGCAQVQRAPAFLEKLRGNREKILRGCVLKSGIRMRQIADPNGTNGVSIPFISESGDCGGTVEALKAMGVPVTRLYPKLVYEFELYRDPRSWGFWKKESANCVNAEKLARRLFWVFNSLEYTDLEIGIIAEALGKV